jgi:hypothetical protein
MSAYTYTRRFAVVWQALLPQGLYGGRTRRHTIVGGAGKESGVRKSSAHDSVDLSTCRI